MGLVEREPLNKTAYETHLSAVNLFPWLHSRDYLIRNLVENGHCVDRKLISWNTSSLF